MSNLFFFVLFFYGGFPPQALTLVRAASPPPLFREGQGQGAPVPSKEIILKKAVKIYEKLHLIDTQISIRDDNKRKAGIFIIYNNLNDKFYVGSAITNRIFSSFRKHCLHGTGSPVTRKALNYHGLENFAFIVYEYYPGIILKDNLNKENLKLLAREAALILELQPPYNVSKGVDGFAPSGAWGPRPHSPGLAQGMGGQYQQEGREFRKNLNFFRGAPQGNHLREGASKPVSLYLWGTAPPNGELVHTYPLGPPGAQGHVWYTYPSIREMSRDKG
jgi:hypothetical protein